MISSQKIYCIHEGYIKAPILIGSGSVYVAGLVGYSLPYQGLLCLALPYPSMTKISGSSLVHNCILRNPFLAKQDAPHQHFYIRQHFAVPLFVHAPPTQLKKWVWTLNSLESRAVSGAEQGQTHSSNSESSLRNRPGRQNKGREHAA